MSPYSLRSRAGKLVGDDKIPSHWTIKIKMEPSITKKELKDFRENQELYPKAIKIKLEPKKRRENGVKSRPNSPYPLNIPVITIKISQV